MSDAMKQTDFQPCAICQKGVMHTGLPLFYKVRFVPMGIDTGAVQRQHGMELLLGGNAALAYHMGPQETMASPVVDEQTVLLCHTCAHEPHTSFLHILASSEEST